MALNRQERRGDVLAPNEQKALNSSFVQQLRKPLGSSERNGKRPAIVAVGHEPAGVTALDDANIVTSKGHTTRTFSNWLDGSGSVSCMSPESHLNMREQRYMYDESAKNPGSTSKTIRLYEC
jgi:hypothetical protein